MTKYKSYAALLYYIILHLNTNKSLILQLHSGIGYNFNGDLVAKKKL